MKFALQLVAALALMLGVSLAAMAETKLTVYTALENDQLAPYKAAIEKAVPGLQVDWVRDSTGVITARFLAEKASPKADMVLGLAASSLLLFQKEGLLEAYKPAGRDSLKAAFRDSQEPYSWTGMDAFLSVVCFNRLEAEKRKTAAPTSWDGSHQTGVQRSGCHAASSLVRHRLPDGCGLDTGYGRKACMGFHGQATRECQRLYALRLCTVCSSRQG